MKSKILIASLLTISIVSCKKNELQSKIEVPVVDVTKAYKDIASEILLTAKNDDNFRTISYAECNKQKYGDYYVKLNELISLNNTHKYWTATTVSKLESLQKVITDTKRNDVIIFIPSIEKHPEKANPSLSLAYSLLPEEPVAVVASEYDNPTQTSRGYIVDINGTLVYYETINESFAWEHDVWVVGEEEIVSPENMIAAVEDTATLTYLRPNGVAEMGGIIKVTDWSIVEPWIAGKPEFRMIAHRALGAPANILVDIKYGKWRRANFNNQFKDFGTFIAHWNLNIIGDWTTEKWIEEDGGSSAPITYNVTYQVNGQTTTANVTLPAKNRDDDLGISLIQFTDPITTIYNQSGVQIKGRN